MKRIIALLLVFIFAFTFAACEDKKNNDNDESSKTESTASSQAESSKTESSAAESSEIESADSSVEESTEESTEEPDDESFDLSFDIEDLFPDDYEEPEYDLNGITIENTVVYDENDVKITLEGMTVESFLGVVVGVTIENKSDKNMSIGSESATINGIMNSAFFSEDVAAGKTAKTEMYIDIEELLAANITVIKDIEFSILAYDPDTWDDLFKSDRISVKTTADESYVQEYDDKGEVILEKDGFKLVFRGTISEDTFFEAKMIDFYIENTTDTDIIVSLDNLSVNNMMVTALFYEDILAGARSYSSLRIQDSDLKDNDIEAIETIEFTVELLNHDYEVILESDPVVINIK